MCLLHVLESAGALTKLQAESRLHIADLPFILLKCPGEHPGQVSFALELDLANCNMAVIAVIDWGLEEDRLLCWFIGFLVALGAAASAGLWA